MQVVNLKSSNVSPDDEKGRDNLFLVDIPDGELRSFLMELDDALSSYYEHVDEADSKSDSEIAEIVMENCGRHYIPIGRAATIEM